MTKKPAAKVAEEPKKSGRASAVAVSTITVAEERREPMTL